MMEAVKLGRDLDLHKTWWVGGIVWALKSTAKEDVKPAIADLLNDAAKEIEALRSALSSEREACAKVAENLASNTQQLLLHSGEMEPQELLTSKAVLKLVASLIRGRGER